MYATKKTKYTNLTEPKLETASQIQRKRRVVLVLNDNVSFHCSVADCCLTVSTSQMWEIYITNKGNGGRRIIVICYI